MGNPRVPETPYITVRHRPSLPRLSSSAHPAKFRKVADELIVVEQKQVCLLLIASRHDVMRVAYSNQYRGLSHAKVKCSRFPRHRKLGGLKFLLHALTLAAGLFRV